jgi:lipoprotein
MKYFPLFLLFLATSCAAPDGAYVFYDEPAYAEKEKRLPINTEQAATLFARNYFEQHPSAEKVTAYIDVLFRRKYIVSLTRLLHNTKFGACFLTPDTYWVDGKTGKLKKNKREVLYLRRVGRADENGVSIFRKGTFTKTYVRDSLLNTP